MTPSEWFNAFRVALVEGEESTLFHLSTTLPSFQSTEEMKEAQTLIQQAITMFQEKKERLGKEMAELTKARKFFTSSQNRPGRLDITS